MNLYVIGRPVNHSLSPLIHNYWLKKYKKKEVYGKLDLDEEDLQEIINKVSNQEILGVNVILIDAYHLSFKNFYNYSMFM